MIEQQAPCQCHYTEKLYDRLNAIVYYKFEKRAEIEDMVHNIKVAYCLQATLYQSV